MKMNKMPVAAVLIVLSWLIAILAVFTSIYLFIGKFGGIYSLTISFLALLGGLILACVVRILGNIGQLLFDLKSFFTRDFDKTLLHNFKETKEAIENGFVRFDKNSQNQAKETKEAIENGFVRFDKNSQNQAKETREVLKSGFTGLNQSLQKQKDELSRICEQIDCDLRDINQSIHQIKVFFEQIERHLDFKK